MTINELESAVSRLKPAELSTFSIWFQEFMAEQWDQQIEADILNGRLDAAGKRADEDFKAERCTPL